jgi:hypothetical protein
MHQPSTAVLAALMSQRRKCLLQLRELSVRQAQIIASSDASDLLRLIAAKQQLIAALQGIEKRLAPYHAQNPEERVWLSAEAREQCAADGDACRKLVEEVMALEQQGERQMTKRRDAVAKQIGTVAAAGRVRDAYLSQR